MTEYKPIRRRLQGVCRGRMGRDQRMTVVGAPAQAVMAQAWAPKICRGQDFIMHPARVRTPRRDKRIDSA